MKVLFITHDGISHEPLGLEYVSASLRRARHKTRACMASGWREAILNWRPHYVAFQVLSGDQDKWGHLGQKIKNEFPAIKTIFGGPHFLFSKQAVQAGADILIRGDGEEAMVEAVEGRSHVNLKAIEDLDSLAPPDRDLFYNDRFPAIKNNVIRNFIACRGCPYQCTYCYNSNPEWLKMVSGKKRLRYHSPEWLVAEIKRTFRDYGGELVSFQDDIFGIDLQWLEEFTRHYKRLRIPFFAQLRPHLITEQRIRLLREAGVHIISFAIESGNENTRKILLDRKEPNALIERGASILHKHGIKFRVQNMLALPVTDPLGDALETLKFNMKLKPTLSWCSLLQAYPGTKIADYVVKTGMVKSMDDLMNHVNATFFDEGSLPVKDKTKIERLHKYWSAVIRWPWLYPLVRILIHINLGGRVHNGIFELSKGYINKREYWRVKDKGQVRPREFQTLDRLGGELQRRKYLQDQAA